MGLAPVLGGLSRLFEKDYVSNGPVRRIPSAFTLGGESNPDIGVLGQPDCQFFLKFLGRRGREYDGLHAIDYE